MCMTSTKGTSQLWIRHAEIGHLLLLDADGLQIDAPSVSHSRTNLIAQREKLTE